MNTALFTTEQTVTNQAGGKAFAMSTDMALLQLAVTGCFNDTFYSKAEEQLKTVLDLASKCSPEWVARVAIYARQNGFMKDMPVVLVAVLSTRDTRLFNFVFDRVIDNVGMLRNFVKVIRSGAVGRKSLGTAPKKAIARLLNSLNGDAVFYQSVGTTPSLEDVLRLAHPKPKDAEHDALYGYLLGKEHLATNLPFDVRNYEDYKSGRSPAIPHVDFRKLTALELTTEQWMAIGCQMSWNQLRLNLNTLARHKCFDSSYFTERVVSRLHLTEAIQKSKVLPFALYNAIRSLDPAVPNSVKEALGYCLDQSLLNAPELVENTLILVDSSGSMNSPVTGDRAGSTTTLNCNTAASYFAASLLKRNPDKVTILPFDTTVHPINVTSRDSVESITTQVSRNGGGTDISCGIVWALQQHRWTNVLIISDNESWFDGAAGYYHMARGTPTASHWAEYKKLVPNARLVCWNITPNTTTQAKTDSSVLNVGGFTETVYALVGTWFNTKSTNTFYETVRAIPLT